MFLNLRFVDRSPTVTLLLYVCSLKPYRMQCREKVLSNVCNFWARIVCLLGGCVGVRVFTYMCLHVSVWLCKNYCKKMQADDRAPFSSPATLKGQSAERVWVSASSLCQIPQHSPRDNYIQSGFVTQALAGHLSPPSLFSSWPLFFCLLLLSLFLFSPFILLPAALLWDIITANEVCRHTAPKSIFIFHQLN